MLFARAISAAAALVVISAAEELAPPPERSISEAVDDGLIVLSPRTQSPLTLEGPVTMNLEGIEYVREPANRCHPDDPCSRVAIKGGAQSAKSVIGQMWMAWSIRYRPAPFAVGLPAAGEITKYDDTKLAPIIEDSPELRHRVRPVSTKSREGSNTKVKRLNTGHKILLFNLASPKELQMISAGNLILEEVGNALVEVGNRGSPIKQARERQAAYSVIGSKEAMISTPSELGQCEITRAYEDGDQRCFYGRCPQCGGYFDMKPEGFRRADAQGTPHHFVCPPEAGGCGGVLEEGDRAAWRAAGVWLPTFESENPHNPAPAPFVSAEVMERITAPGQFPHRGYRVSTRDCEGRQPSYSIWQAMCGLISWDKIATSIDEAKTPADLKTLEQQVYGRAWDPSVEAMDWEELHRLCEEYEAQLVPSGAEIVTAFTDVQGDYLEGGAIAWGPGGEWWVVERWVISGDTAGDAPWLKLDEYYRRRYAHADGGEVPIAAFGVDTGFRTQRAYAFCRGRPNAYAMDGRPGWTLPILGRPKPVKVIEKGRVKGRVKLWPTGTWELKSMLAWSLKLSVEAGYQTRHQGRGHWSRREDEAWCQQITAEGLAEEKDDKTGELKRWWRKLRERNEWVDVWVGARALAWNLGVGAPRKDGQGEAVDWAARAAARAGREPQADLFARPVRPARPSPATAEPAAVSDPSPERRFYRRRPKA